MITCRRNRRKEYILKLKKVGRKRMAGRWKGEFNYRSGKKGGKGNVDRKEGLRHVHTKFERKRRAVRREGEGLRYFYGTVHSGLAWKGMRLIQYSHQDNRELAAC